MRVKKQIENEAFYKAAQILQNDRKTWLITGAAGFIGSNLLEFLLNSNQKVVGIDNFETGSIDNLEEVERLVGTKKARNFHFVEGDLKDIKSCKNICKGIDHVLHQAARGSVSRSIENPEITDLNNVNGFVNLLTAAKDSGVKNFIYASSSSVYGDSKTLPKEENTIGECLSPYAVSKYTNELYSRVFFHNYGFKSIGLRYFNVFGSRQNPYGAYAAVIPAWISSIIENLEVKINGDGSTSRDFCHVNNVVQVNVLATLTESRNISSVFNVACGEQTSLIDLLSILKRKLANLGYIYNRPPTFGDFRPGDVKHSLADISKAKVELGYSPKTMIEEGLSSAVEWYVSQYNKLRDQ